MYFDDGDSIIVGDRKYYVEVIIDYDVVFWIFVVVIINDGVVYYWTKVTVISAAARMMTIPTRYYDYLKASSTAFSFA